MAKKKPEDESTETALATKRSVPVAMQVADGVDAKDVRGKEGLDTSDVTLPRISICQNNSPEKDEDDAKYIAGLKEGDLFNTLTQDIYGGKDSLLEFVVIRPMKRAMEFDEDRNIIDYDVPWDDPRCEFRTVDGKRLKPLATRFYDYVVYLPQFGDTALLSFSNTKIKAAKKLNSLIALRPGPSWAGRYALGVVKEENDQGKFFNVTITPKGKTDAETMAEADRLYEQFRGKTVKSDAVDPDADGAEKEPSTRRNADGVPF